MLELENAVDVILEIVLNMHMRNFVQTNFRQQFFSRLLLCGSKLTRKQSNKQMKDKRETQETHWFPNEYK